MHYKSRLFNEIMRYTMEEPNSPMLHDKRHDTTSDAVRSTWIMELFKPKTNPFEEAYFESCQRFEDILNSS